jgi:sporulation protein YlmC with PRC-barrel domain
MISPSAATRLACCVVLSLGLTTPALRAANAPAPPATTAPSPKPPASPAPAKIAKVDANGILGRAVLGPDGHEIGRVVDVLVDSGGHVRAAVIDFGGFLGVGTRRVAVDWADLTFPTSGSSADIRLDLTVDQIKNAPVYSDQTKAAAVAEPPAKTPPASASASAGNDHVPDQPKSK